jgi:uncharacterized protein (DUF697 family)
MPKGIKLANLWRVVRDVDLERIRDVVDAPFVLALVAADPEDGRQLAAALSSPGAPHPWLVAMTPGSHPADLPAAAAAAVLVTRTTPLDTALAVTRSRFLLGSTPVVTVVVDPPGTDTGTGPREVQAGPREAPADPGEALRLHVAAIDERLVAHLAPALLAAAGPDRRLALARRLPLLRPAVFDLLIEETARANAAFAFTTGLAEVVPPLTAPLNLGDIVILTKNQLLMCYRMAVVAGWRGEPRALMGEIAGVLGGGVLFRQAARQLVGLVPVVGIVPKVAVAYGGTWAIGRAMAAWVVEGRRMTADTVKGYASEGMARGREVAARLRAQASGAGRGATRRWEAFRGQLPWLRRRGARS